MHEKPPQSNENNLEQQRVEKIFELVKTNPNFKYVVSVNGNLLGKGEIDGQKDFHFDQNSHRIELSSTGFNESEYAVLDNNNLLKPLKEGEARFDVENWKRKLDGKEFIHYIWRLAFNGRSENKFTKDPRPGVHISTALRVLKDKKIFGELSDEKLKEYMSNPKTSEAKKFFGELFQKANQEFIPDYWNFVLKERGLYFGQNKK